MRSPPKKEGRLCWTALKDAELRAFYRLLAFLQAPFAFVFWKIEQRIAKLDVEIERRRS